jgi:hypothetical protein
VALWRLPRPDFHRLVDTDFQDTPLSLRPDDLLTILKMALSIGIRNSISLLSAIQATRPLTITLVGLSPTEHTSLFLDTLPYGGFSLSTASRSVCQTGLPVAHEVIASNSLHPSFVHLAACNTDPRSESRSAVR